MSSISQKVESNKKTVATSLARISAITEKENFWKGTALILFGLVIFSQIFDVRIAPKSYLFQNNRSVTSQQSTTAKNVKVDTTLLKASVIPENGVVLPITWADLGQQMIKDGVIDEFKFRALFEEGLTAAEEEMLTGNMEEPIVMDSENSRFMLDMLWAFGLANKNDILENGEMTSEDYGGDASKFASTGGWSLSKGAGFDHYSKHSYVTLTREQQKMVDEVSRNIYRPCCGNSTHFPDCNHGMAMLGLLELMAANNISESQMYDVALKVNSLWFPQTYIDLATYFQEQGTQWEDVDAKTVLGFDYSSAKGYQETRQNIQSLPKPQQGGGGCGV